jgi:hypothetical protein
MNKAVPICWVWVFQSPKYVVGVSSWCPDHQAPRVGWLLPSAGFVFSVSSWWWSTSWFWMSLSKNLATVVPIYSNDDTFFTWIARFCLTASSHFYMVSLLVLVAKPTRAIWDPWSRCHLKDPRSDNTTAAEAPPTRPCSIDHRRGGSHPQCRMAHPARHNAHIRSTQRSRRACLLGMAIFREKNLCFWFLWFPHVFHSYSSTFPVPMLFLSYFQTGH